jgi:hypothetical protein
MIPNTTIGRPFGEGGRYSFLPLDLHPLLVLLMQRLTDDAADDDGIIWDFAESFGLNRRAVLAAVRPTGTQARLFTDAMRCDGIKSA